MEPTDAQSERIKKLRSAFGRATIKPHAPDSKTGLLRVEATCLAGVWQWYLDTDGNLIDRHMTARLFDMPQATVKPHNAIDN